LSKKDAPFMRSPKKLLFSSAKLSHWIALTKSVAMKFARTWLYSIVLAFAANASFAQLPSDLIFKSGMDHPLEGPFTPEEAARFLQQATFGPKLADIELLTRIGYNAWFDQQFAATRSEHLPFIDGLLLGGDTNVFQGARIESWWRNVLGGNDQLRQRMAFSLSQIFVVSDQSGALEGLPTSLAHYYDMLSRNAFGSYRTLLSEATLHPSMGRYLSMHKNRKPDAVLNIQPDQNYAREIMQLFSIGLVRLNTDGTRMLSAGQPIPTYNTDTIRGFAHVFTGWNYSTCVTPTGPNQTWHWDWCGTRAQADPESQDYRLHRGWREPMRPFGEGSVYEAVYHSSVEGPMASPTGAKQLLIYPGVSPANGVLPSGGTARANMNIALDNVANHPNVGPFISRLLIQRFVTSSPSPAYIGRVASIFNNNGAGVRGDLRAVVRAILMDTEARRPTAVNRGKLREPLLRLSQLYRAFDAASRVPDRFNEYTDYWMAQAPLSSPTVFNYYLPNYQLPGEITTLGLFSPEFQITTDTYITRIVNEMGGKVFWQFQGNASLPPVNQWNPTLVNINRDLSFANNAEVLVSRYSLLMMGGTMSTAMSNLLVAHVRDMPNNNDEDRRRRVQDVLWLIMNSPEYVVEK